MIGAESGCVCAAQSGALTTNQPTDHTSTPQRQVKAVQKRRATAVIIVATDGDPVPMEAEAEERKILLMPSMMVRTVLYVLMSCNRPY